MKEKPNYAELEKRIDFTALAGKLGQLTEADNPQPKTVFTLLDKVRLQATTESTRSRTAESNIAASFLDPRFASDPEYPNQWRPVTRDDDGRRHLGSPQPYSGFGGYAKATRLVEPAGAVLIEYHAAFAEPQDWFGGTNLLRSKLPILAQIIVRQLRRGMEKQRPAPAE